MIDFQKKYLTRLDLQHNDALVINIHIAQVLIYRLHVDEGMETKINKSARSLTCFNGATIVTVGIIELDIYSPPVISSQTFMIIDEVSSYNDIPGKPWIGKINGITSTNQFLEAVSDRSTTIR